VNPCNISPREGEQGAPGGRPRRAVLGKVRFKENYFDKKVDDWKREEKDRKRKANTLGKSDLSRLPSQNSKRKRKVKFTRGLKKESIDPDARQRKNPRGGRQHVCPRQGKEGLYYNS